MAANTYHSFIYFPFTDGVPTSSFLFPWLLRCIYIEGEVFKEATSLRGLFCNLLLSLIPLSCWRFHLLLDSPKHSYFKYIWCMFAFRYIHLDIYLEASFLTCSELLTSSQWRWLALRGVMFLKVILWICSKILFPCLFFPRQIKVRIIIQISWSVWLFYFSFCGKYILISLLTHDCCGGDKQVKLKWF